MPYQARPACRRPHANPCARTPRAVSPAWTFRTLSTPTLAASWRSTQTPWILCGTTRPARASSPTVCARELPAQHSGLCGCPQMRARRCGGFAAKACMPLQLRRCELMQQPRPARPRRTFETSHNNSPLGRSAGHVLCQPPRWPPCRQQLPREWLEMKLGLDLGVGGWIGVSADCMCRVGARPSPTTQTRSWQAPHAPKTLVRACPRTRTLASPS